VKTLAVLLLLLSSVCHAQQVAYTASVNQMGTSTKLRALTVGQSFDLVLSAQDLRPSGTWTDAQGTAKPKIRGVFAAYCDVKFDPNLAKLTHYSGGDYLGCFTFSSRYPNGPKASPAEDRINDVGAFASAFTGNRALVEVWRVRMTAKNAGALVFAPAVDQVPHPQCDTLVYGNIGAIPPEQSYVDPAQVVLIPCAVTVSP
jgi:hypothetical protein